MTIFSAPNYCNHLNPATVFVANRNDRPRVLVYDEAPYKPYYLPIMKADDEDLEDYRIRYPVVPNDAISWFMDPMA